MGIVSGLGILAYMIFLQVQFHDALAFMHAQHLECGHRPAQILYA